jgi:hypothetical protein
MQLLYRYAVSKRDEAVNITFVEGQTVRLVHGEGCTSRIQLTHRLKPPGPVSTLERMK